MKFFVYALPSLLLFLFPAFSSAETLFSQNDPEWANYRLGWSDTTIGEYGCFLTSLAMITSDYRNERITPLELQNLIIDVDGFTRGNGEFATPVITKIFPDIHVTGALTMRREMQDFDYTHVSAWQLERAIATRLLRGEYVLAQVDSTPEDAYDHEYDQHWVVLVGMTKDDYVALDPTDGTHILLSDWYADERGGSEAFPVLSAIFIER